MPKQSLNLSSERESLERGQRYSQRYGVSISNLVDDILARLPLEDEDAGALTPDVRSLIGIGAGNEELLQALALPNLEDDLMSLSPWNVPK